ncbi:MAG: hypothetical protein QXO15_03380 [Nitrososphaerota archaeon]
MGGSNGNEGAVTIIIKEYMRRPIFTISSGSGVETFFIKGRGRKWIEELILMTIYRYGTVTNISTREKRLYPPILTFSVPKDKAVVISALKYMKRKDRDKLLRLYREDFDMFAKEVTAIAVARVLKKDWSGGSGER